MTIGGRKEQSATYNRRQQTNRYICSIKTAYSLLCFLDERPQPLDFLSLHQPQHLAEAVGAHGGEGKTVKHVYTPQVIAPQTSLLAEETHHVALAQAVAFPLTYI